VTVAGPLNDSRQPAALARRIGANLAAWSALLVRSPRANVAHAAWWPLSRLAIGGAMTIAAVAAAMILLDGWAIAHDRAWPLWLVRVFNEITDFGKAEWFLVPAGVLLIALAALASPALSRISNLVITSIAVRVGFVFFAVALPSLFSTIIKRLIGRARPLRVPGHDVAFAPFAWRVEYASLPSGHATTAFAAAVALGALFPRARPALWAYAAIIAISRVVLVAHYPSDVIAGAVVGACGALLVRRWYAARRLAFTFALDGTLRAMAGPSWRRLREVAGPGAGP
jgi:membrane-associated phospholipid phosphatase